MSEFNLFSIKSFLRKLSHFTSSKYLERDNNPTKRREIQKIITKMNNVICNNENYTDTNITDIGTSKDKILYKINETLSTIVNNSSTNINVNSIYQLLSSFGDIHFLLEDCSKAIEDYKEALILCTKSNNLSHQANTKFQLGKLYYEMNEYDSAIDCFFEAQQLFKNLNNYSQEMECQYTLSRINYKKGKYLTAHQYCKEALQLAEQINNYDKIASIKNHLGLICRIIGEKKESEELFKCANVHFKNIKDNTNYVNTLNNLSKTHLLKSNYQKALTGFNECLDMGSKIKNLELLVFINLNKAQFYLAVGDPRNAAHFCLNGLEISILNNYKIGLAKVCRIYGNIFKNYYQYKIADKFFSESIWLYEKMQIPLGLANCCSDYAEMLVDIDQIDQAIEYYKMAQEIYYDLELSQYVDKLQKTINSPQFSIIAEAVTQKSSSI